jgi:hypothetical protein
MARKKEQAGTIPESLVEAFDKCPFPIPSRFEFDNFKSQTGTGFSRHIVDTINRVRKIDSDIEQTTGSFELECLAAERTMLLDYLQEQNPNALKSSVLNWEMMEKEYWINTLGKQAAIEILTIGKPSVETMNKMVRLPEESYIKATQICVKLANAIKSTTVAAETQIGVVVNAPDESAMPAPNVEPAPIAKLKIKKK